MPSLKIASYNIRKAVGRDRRRDPARILAVLNEIGADVVVLQEADRRLGPRPTAIPRFLIEQETDYAVADLARNEVSLGWHGNAILARRGLKIGATKHIDLPGLEPRGAVLAEIAGISVIGAHLGLLRRWRLLQMTAICGHVAKNAATTLIAGDFNEWSNRRGYEPLQNDFSLVLPGRSFHTARPVASLDVFAHGTGLAVSDYGVSDTPRSRVASDHFPIWAQIEAP